MIDKYKQFVDAKKRIRDNKIVPYRIEKYQDKLQKELNERKGK